MNHASIEVKVSKQKDSDRYRFVASTNTVDRSGDIVAQNFDLRPVRKNPVFLWVHRYGEPPLGKMVKITTEKTGETYSNGLVKARTISEVVFVPKEISPFAGVVRELYDQGFLKAVSVGFKPTEVKQLTSEEREALGLGRWGLFFTKSEMLELSAVTVPANPEALMEKKEFIDDMTQGRGDSVMSMFMGKATPEDQQRLLRDVNHDEVAEFLKSIQGDELQVPAEKKSTKLIVEIPGLPELVTRMDLLLEDRKDAASNGADGNDGDDGEDEADDSIELELEDDADNSEDLEKALASLGLEDDSSDNDEEDKR